MKIEKILWHGLDAVLMETAVYEAVIVPSIGANLVKLYNKSKQVDILRTPKASEIDTFKSRPQIFGVPLLFPPNRIEDGTYTFKGKKYDFPISIPTQNNYHHGIIKSEAFTITRTRFSSDAIEVEASFFSNRINNKIYANFPHEFVCKIRFILTDNELMQIVSFTNLGIDVMPLGVGYHTPICVPFTADGNPLDYKLRLSVGKRWELNDRGLPTGNLLELTDEELLLLTYGMVPTGKGFEYALTNQAMMVNEKPYSGAIITDTKNDISVYYEVDNQFKHWTLWNNGGEVDYVCPEPQTWAINAPNIDLPHNITGFQTLAGGKTWSGTTRFYVK